MGIILLLYKEVESGSHVRIKCCCWALFVIPVLRCIFRLIFLSAMRKFFLGLLAGVSFLTALTSCEDSKVDYVPVARKQTFNYGFNEGQLQGFGKYGGPLGRNLLASLTLEELRADTSTQITLLLRNSSDTVIYPVGFHPVNNRNGLGFDSLANKRVLSDTIRGNRTMDVSRTYKSDVPYDSLINFFDGYLIVQDPKPDTPRIQPFTPANFPVFGSFAR